MKMDPHIVQWVNAWKKAGTACQQIRLEESQKRPLSEIISLLDDAFEASMKTYQPRPYSGLIEQQRWFAKMRK